MKKHHRLARLRIAGLLILLALGVIVGGLMLLDRRADAPMPPKVPVLVKKNPTLAKPTPAPAFDAKKYSTTEAASLWVIVNKQHPLNPVAYTPADLVNAYGHQVSNRLVPDLNAMVSGAARDNARLTVVSSFRSYSYQVTLYNSYVSKDGQAKADEYSARPGYSEHQTGLAIDFGNAAGTCPVEACYGDTVEGKWLTAHAYEYGFLLRYPSDKQAVTGYESEPWHYRYIGRELALEMHKKGVTTLEEFFNVTGGEQYN